MPSINLTSPPSPLVSVCFLQFEPAQVSRFLVSLGASGLPVTLALNKADLLPAAEIQERLDQVRVLWATSWHVLA
jgi:putative ribosome biogenesis GTPase RsgA